jgi:hypothetical protein
MRVGLLPPRSRLPAATKGGLIAAPLEPPLAIFSVRGSQAPRSRD